ncbi:hypothetical protein KP509_25G007400 [Ceratopteris richardii]|uniref:Uncharacterized protein n=1 Tax=Ceratopteris richardii TaxID=49495 RepID=A0A8T2RQ46_CERRI|nr:hypothetical protein KP509_25G007400 [Ceratopteris richardii]
MSYRNIYNLMNQMNDASLIECCDSFSNTAVVSRVQRSIMRVNGYDYFFSLMLHVKPLKHHRSPKGWRKESHGLRRGDGE